MLKFRILIGDILFSILLVIVAMVSPSYADFHMAITEGTYIPKQGSPYSVTGTINFARISNDHLHDGDTGETTFLLNGFSPIINVVQTDSPEPDSAFFSSWANYRYSDNFPAIDMTLYYTLSSYDPENRPAFDLDFKYANISIYIAQDGVQSWQNSGRLSQTHERIHLIARPVDEPPMVLLFAAGLICFGFIYNRFKR